MGQFVVALLIGGFFATLVITLQYLTILIDGINSKESIVDEEEFVVEVPYGANVFRTKKNKEWLFTDMVITNIIQYMRSEIRKYGRTFNKQDSIELSHILVSLTPEIEDYVKESKRCKLDSDLYSQIVDVQFNNDNDEKRFIMRSVFKEIHNTLIQDALSRRITC